MIRRAEANLGAAAQRMCGGVFPGIKFEAEFGTFLLLCFFESRLLGDHNFGLSFEEPIKGGESSSLRQHYLDQVSRVCSETIRSTLSLCFRENSGTLRLP